MEEIQDNISNLKINQPGNNLNYSVISTSYHQLSHFITKGEIKDKLIPNPNFSLKNYEQILDNNNSPMILGKGTFSTIFLYQNNHTKKKYAVKHIYKEKVIESTNSLNIVNKEIDIHSRFIHKNIIRLYSHEENTDSYDLLLEYAPNGNLFQLIKRKNTLSENECFAYFIQAADAVYFLHDNNIIHRDIKPENLLLFNKSTIKLCDFGWSTELEIANRTTFCGTLEYMAPEIIKEEPYEKSVDIWALGVLLFEMFFGFSPFKPQENLNDFTQEILGNILKGDLVFPQEKKINPDMKNLISCMIDKVGKKRITIKEIFEHPWVKKFEYKIYGSISTEVNNYNYDKIFEGKRNNINENKKIQDCFDKSSSVKNIFTDKEKEDRAFFDNVLKNTKTKKKNRKFSQNRVEKDKQNIYNNNFNNNINNNLLKIPIFDKNKNQRKNHFEELNDRNKIMKSNQKSMSYQKKVSADEIYNSNNKNNTYFNIEVPLLKDNNDFISSINESHLVHFRKSKKLINPKKYPNTHVEEAIKIIDESQNNNQDAKKQNDDKNLGIFCCTFFNCN